MPLFHFSYRSCFFALLLLSPFVATAQFDRFPKNMETKDWKHYFVDSLGRPINNLIFDNVQPFMKGMAVVQNHINEETHSALLNVSGKVIVPFGSHYIRNEGNGFATVSDTIGTRVYNNSGKLITSCRACEVSFHPDIERISTQPQAYSYDGRISPLETVAVYDYTGKEIFRKKGTSIKRLSNQATAETDERQKELLPYFYIAFPTEFSTQLYKIVNLRGEAVMDSVFSLSTNEPAFVFGLMTIGTPNRAAILKKDFSFLLPFSAGYQSLYEMYGHPAGQVYSAEKNGRFGAITEKNEIIVPFRYPYRLNYSTYDSLYRMNKPDGDSAWTFNLRLDTLETPAFRRLGMKTLDDNTGIFEDPKTLKKGILQFKSRRIIVPAIYTSLTVLSKDSILYFRNDTAGIMNSSGKVVFRFPAPCYGATGFQNGRALCVAQAPGQSPDVEAPLVKYFWLNPKCGIINNAFFDWFAKFDNGRALVANDGRYFMVDTLMRPIKALGKYDYYSYFSQGYAIIGQEAKKFGVINDKGTIVVPVEYDGVNSVSERGLADEYRDVQNGIPYYDVSGNMQVTNGFRYVPEIIDGLITVTKGEKEEELVLFGNRVPQKKTGGDSLMLWYNCNQDLVIREEDLDKIQIPLDGNEVTMIPYRQDELFGFVNKKTGAWMIQPRFEQVHAVYKEGAIVKINGAYAFTDTSGKLLFGDVQNIVKEGDIYHCLSLLYPEGDLPEPHDMCIVNAYYTKRGKLLFTEKAHDLVSFTDTDSLAFFRYGKTITIRGKSGKIWKRARVNDEKKLMGVQDNLLIYKSIRDAKVWYTCTDVRGKEAFSLPLAFDRVEGLCRISKDLFGFVAKGGIYFYDAKGVQKPWGIEEVYGSQPGNFFRNKRFSVHHFRKKRSGVVDRQGKTLIPFDYKAIGEFHNGYALFRDTLDRIGMMDSLGKTVLSYLSEDAIELSRELGRPLTFYEGLCPVKQYCLLKVIGDDGKESFRINPDSMCFTYIDQNGKAALSLPSTFEMGGFFSDGLAPVLDGKGNFGFIDKKGQIVIPPEYEAMLAGGYPIAYLIVPEFIGGFAYIKSWKGYIDKTGKKYYAGKRVKDEYRFSH